MKIRSYCFIGMIVACEMILLACGTKVVEQTKESEVEEKLQQEEGAISTDEQNRQKQNMKEEAEEKTKPLVGIQEEKSLENKGLKELREQMQKDNKQLAVAFLGYGTAYESIEKKAEYEAAYPFLQVIDKDHYVTCGGDELYVIVPKSKQWNLSIYELLWGEGYEEGKEGACLYKSQDGKPIILCCNVSDLYSNVRVSISEEGEAFAWEPAVSLKESATLVKSPWIYDFSLSSGNEGEEAGCVFEE